MKKLLLSLGVVVGIAVSSVASATIVGGAITGGSAFNQGASFFNLGNSPVGLSIGNNTIQNSNLYGFNEDQNILLGADLAIDTGLTAFISSGTVVASHYIYFDPKNSVSVKGYVDFDSEILGIISSTANLAASDFLINNSVTYLNPILRGLEANDSAWIEAGNNQRLGLSFIASSPGDYIRVLTATSPLASVPAPATLLLFILGLLAMSKRFHLPAVVKSKLARKVIGFAA